MISVEYDAVLVDTSMFDGNGLRLEKGLLARLAQFKDSSVTYLFPDVIRNEVEAHLNTKIKAARSGLQKALKDAEEHLFFEGSPLNSPKNKLISGEEIEELARTRLNAFIDRSGALTLVCGEWVEVSQVLDFYFANKAPFAESGKKKSEFPDAFTLLAAEAWADKNDKQVLAIARDKDWESYCANSSRITYSDDFASGLEYFNTLQIPKDFVAKLEVALDSNDAESFLDSIRSELEHTINGITPEQDASSPLYWQPEGAHAWLSDFDLVNNSFRIVDELDDWMSVEALASITVEAEGDFSLSAFDSIDKDYVLLGSITAHATTTYETALLISISGDLSASIDQVVIDDLEVSELPNLIDFGYIELE